MKYDLPAIKESLMEHFNDSEIRDICFALEVDYEAIDGANKSDKTRELLTYLNRRSRVVDLIVFCQQQRPATKWNLFKSQSDQNSEFVNGIGLSGSVSERYADAKFELYRSVWQYLSELKVAGDYLWQRVSKENIANFASVLRQTRSFVQISKDLFERQDYADLVSVFDRLGRFEAGKMALLEIRSVKDEYLIFPEAAKYQIERNRAVKAEYEELVGRICDNFKRQIEL